MGRIFLLTLTAGLLIGAFPALAEKQYKMSCYEWCAKNKCTYGRTARWDLVCNSNCESRCNIDACRRYVEKLEEEMIVDVRFGSKADMCSAKWHVR